MTLFKNLLVFLLKSAGIFIVSFLLFYCFEVFCYKQFGLWLFDTRYMHHFVAGVYFPFFFKKTAPKVLRPKIRKDPRRISVLFGFVYLFVSFYWEIGQMIVYTRGFQGDQFFFDALGVSVYLLIVVMATKRLRAFMFKT